MRKERTESIHRLFKLVLGLTAVALLASAPALYADEPAKEKQTTETTKPAEKTKPAETVTDSTGMKLRGGEEGTLFESLRVEGEDRVRISFERPQLDLSLDAGTAPGLDWKSVDDVIDRIGVDLLNPFLARSAGERPGVYTKPWLEAFSTDGIARFQPKLEGVDRWRLLVADSKGDTVASFSGNGKPPKEIVWDGRSLKGDYVAPGLVYSYVLEAYDKAGNKRNFVGEGFQIPAYRVVDDGVHAMLFSGAELTSKNSNYGEAAPPPAVLQEVASWANQEEDVDGPVRVVITGRDFRNVKHLADEVTRQLTPLLLGNPLRVQMVTNVEADAPERATVAVFVRDDT
jgi:hypothetical protein